MFSNWRGCQEFSKLGLPLSTTSDEAVKLYDATLTQWIGWYEDPSMGGIVNCMQKLIQADPQFVMGHVMVNSLTLAGTDKSVAMDKDLQRSLETMVTLAGSASLTEREQKHVEAVGLWTTGEMKAACNVWEEILLNHPLDMLAIKMTQLGYYYLGLLPQLRDSSARCLSAWKPTTPLYGYMLGICSFGYEETNLYRESERLARKALEINKKDAWSTHVLCHVMDMEGRQKEGIDLMSSTEKDWNVSGMIAGHNYWHWALHHIELNNYEEALGIFDNVLAGRCNRNASMLDLTDIASLLFRLEMEGVNVKDRWNDVTEICRPHIDDHISVFNDAHIMIGCMKSHDNDVVEKMIDSLKEHVRNNAHSDVRVMRDVGIPMCEALAAYENGDFGRAVDLMYPIRYDVVKGGGSNAQRDVFSQFLIHAAMKSPEAEHQKLARHLLMERKALKENSPMTDRLIGQLMASHDHS